jgi:hypothetical protein
MDITRRVVAVLCWNDIRRGENQGSAKLDSALVQKNGR